MKKVSIDLFSKVKYLSKLKNKGNHLSFVVSTCNVEANNYESSIYLYDLFKKSERRLTTGKHDGQYFWLNDEEIIFCSKREEAKEKIQKTVFYKINIHGGEAEEFITLPYQVSQTVLMKNQLYFVASYTETMDKLRQLEGHEQEDYVKSLKEDDDYDVVTEIPFWSNGGTYTKAARNLLYVYDLETKEITRLTDPPLTVMSIYGEEEYDQLFVTAQTYGYKKSLYSDLYVLRNGLEKIGFEQDFAYRKMIQITNDKLLVTGSDMSHFGLFENAKFYEIDLNDNKISSLTPDLKLAMSNAVGSDLRFGNVDSPFQLLDGHVVYMLLNGFKNELHQLGRDSKKILDLPGALDEYVVVNNKIYGIGLFNQNLHELYELDDMTSLTAHNEDIMVSYDWIKPEHFEFENRAGMPMDGFVIRPRESGKVPTILNIHGGPKTAYGDVLYHEMQYWANQGYAVIFTNPRGSEGKDNKFADIRGKYGTIDYEDIMDFVDETIKKYDFIDETRLGVTGGSYGGFMTNWIIGHTDRFKAAATQRSISNWFSFFGTSDIGYYFAPDQVASTPWDNPEMMWMQSPIKYADKIKTPTLVIHSHEDYRCWTPDAYQLFTALRYFDIPSRMVMFKGENHELSRGGKPKHRIRRIKEITDWMDLYLKE